MQTLPAFYEGTTLSKRQKNVTFIKQFSDQEKEKLRVTETARPDTGLLPLPMNRMSSSQLNFNSEVLKIEAIDPETENELDNAEMSNCKPDQASKGEESIAKRSKSCPDKSTESLYTEYMMTEDEISDNHEKQMTTKPQESQRYST